MRELVVWGHEPWLLVATLKGRSSSVVTSDCKPGRSNKHSTHKHHNRLVYLSEISLLQEGTRTYPVISKKR